MKVRKAIIPAAGLGTRFLPASKTVPKEMFPLIDRPLILHIVEEAVAAGIEDIVIVAGRGKSAIEDFFDRSYEVEDILLKSGKDDLVKAVSRLRDLANIVSIRQKEALGLGHAVLTAKPIVGNEPFAVLLGDEIMVGEPNPTRQLCQNFEKSDVSTVSIMEVPKNDVSKYGIVQVRPLSNDTFVVENVIEKPEADQAPSRWALPGRYVFHPEIFRCLESVRPGRNGEIQLTDGMAALAKSRGLQAQPVRCRRYDAGDKLGYMQAGLELGVEHPEIGPRFRDFVKKFAEGLS